MTNDNRAETKRERDAKLHGGIYDHDRRPRYNWQRGLSEKEIAYLSKLLKTIKPYPDSPMDRAWSIYDKLKYNLNSDHPKRQQWARRFLLKLEAYRDKNFLKSTCKRGKPYRVQPLYRNRKPIMQEIAELLASPEPRKQSRGLAMKKIMEWQIENIPEFKAAIEKAKAPKKTAPVGATVLKMVNGVSIEYQKCADGKWRQVQK
ncbi:MAG: hypothetical protein PHC61_04570 [Chitinivibrionales bacterium]|nr:hypothetical protein [Chitinivibrionales bacterium]